MGSVSFKEALELVESLPNEDRRSLIEIVRRRLVDERREEIAKSIQGSRDDLARGDVSRGTVEDLLRDLRT